MVMYDVWHRMGNDAGCNKVDDVAAETAGMRPGPRKTAESEKQVC